MIDFVEEFCNEDWLNELSNYQKNDGRGHKDCEERNAISHEDFWFF